MNKLFYPLLCLGLTAVVWSCTKDNAQDVFGDCNPVDVKLSTDINPIFAANCLGCHDTQNAFGGIDLTNYTHVKQLADNGKLYGAINHEQGFSVMPPSGTKLPECDIETIKTWIDEGSENN